MSRRYPLTHARSIVIALILPILVIGGGYALFSQNLSIQGTATAEVSSAQAPSLQFAWTMQKWQSNGVWSYNVTGQVKNTGTIAATGWTITVTLPSTITGLNCWNGDCSITSTSLMIQNMNYNGSINPGATADFGMSFTANSDTVSFSNYMVKGDSPQTVSNNLSSINGLTVKMVYDNGWQANGGYVTQYTVMVTNNSGTKVKTWRTEVSNWDSATQSVVNIWNASYTSEQTRLLMMSTGALANGASTSFGVQLQASSASWTPSYGIKGAL